MATVLDIIKLSMKDIGALSGRGTPSDDETQDALDSLNQMLAIWRTESLSVYCQKEYILPITGAQSYTIGISGNLNVERPVSIDEAFWRLNSVDTPLTIIHSYEDYQDIDLKTVNGVPGYLYYRPDFPLAQLFLWAVPTTGELHLTVKQSLPVYITLADTITLPPEYLAPIRYNLNEYLCPTFGQQMTPELVKMARSTKKALKRVNSSIVRLKMPNAVMSTVRSVRRWF